MERAIETLSNATIDRISSLLGSSLLQVSPPFPAFSHNVYTVQSQKGQIWIVRVARDEFAAHLASRGMAIMRHILSERPELPIPAILHADQEFTILTYIEGSPLRSWNPVDLSVERRHNLLDGLANFLYQLWTCPIPTTESGKEYYVQDRPDVC
jgi:Ser/Thr protein kinase RdoA (MazF antagonist)